MNHDYLSDLNESQRKAVEYCDGPSLVIASAGSGKTRVLTYKIAHLINLGYEPWSIMALTFTNKAAKVMKERIDKLLGDGSSRYLWMGTFHSVFLRLLRTEHEILGFGANLTIYDQSDSESLLKTIVKERELDDKIYKPAIILNRISMAKSRLVDAIHYARDPYFKKDDIADNLTEVSELFRIYEDRCRLANAMDFDDILFYTYKLFNEHPDILSKYANRFKYILVDEYQDTNFAQHAIVYQLTTVNKKLCVVGDDSQSIYSFRGASINNILKFNEAYPNYKLFKLEQNYRSTQVIVNAANSLIEKNQFKIEKNAFSNNEGGNLISINETSSDIEEAAAVVKKIIAMHEMEHLAFSSFAILYRTNSQSRVFEEKLREKKIPYIIYGGLSFYKRKEIKDIIAYFKLVVNHNDEEAFKRIINYPARGIGRASLNKVIECAEKNKKSLFEVIERPTQCGLELNKGTIAKLEAFRNLINDFTLFSENADAFEVGKEIIIKSGISSDLYNDTSTEGQARQQNLEELVSAINMFVESKKEEGDNYVMLIDYLSEVSLMSDIDSENADEGNSVKLMTVHTAKGLEFNTVFIVGLEEELFPSARSNSPKALEEERRLFYVALTRAEKNCFLSYAKSRFRFGSVEFAVPSRFIHEIDSKYLTIYRTHGGGVPTRKKTRYDQIFKDESFKTNYNQNYNIGLKRVQATDNPYHSTTASHTESISTNKKYNLSVGDRIAHSRFGEGIIEKLEGNDENSKATVLFDNVGRKQLLLKFAKFSKI